MSMLTKHYVIGRKDVEYILKPDPALQDGYSGGAVLECYVESDLAASIHISADCLALMEEAFYSARSDMEAEKEADL